MQVRIGGVRRLVAMMAVFAATAVASSSLASVSDAAPRSGVALRVVVTGLPPGQPGLVAMRGPHGFHRTLRGAAIAVGNLAPGRYRLLPKKVKISSRKGNVLKGATARPSSSALKVRVIRGKTQVAHVSYGSIVNPGVVPLPESAIQVIGARNNPKAIAVAHGGSLRVGQIVTSGPTPELPSGLVSRISAVKFGSRLDRFYLDPVPVTDAVPVIDTGGATPIADQAQTSALLGLKVEQDIARRCGLSAQAKLNPIIQLSGTTVDADINANPWAPKADLVVSGDWTFGFKLNAIGTIYCKKEVGAPTLPLAIPVGPILVPAFVALPVTVRVSLKGETKAQVTYSWRSQVGIRTRRAGPVLIPRPVFTVTRPSASLSISATPEISVEGGVDVEAGVGVRNVADVSFKAGTSLEAVLEPSSCRLDWKLGNLSAGGRVGPFYFGTPDFTVFTHRIWTGCRSASGGGGGGGGGQRPADPEAPEPSPPAPPGLGAGFASAIGSGAFHTCAIRSDETVSCWGANVFGQSTPPSGTFKAISADASTTCGIRSDDTLSCWGDNGYGQAAPPSGAFKSVDVGHWHSCAIRFDDTVECWGSNGSSESSPPGGGFKSVSAGYVSTCGIQFDDTVECWGSNNEGQMTPPSGTFKSVSTGSLHACGIRSDDTVICWGGDTYPSGENVPPGRHLQIDQRRLRVHLRHPIRRHDCLLGAPRRCRCGPERHLQIDQRRGGKPPRLRDPLRRHGELLGRAKPHRRERRPGRRLQMDQRPRVHLRDPVGRHRRLLGRRRHRGDAALRLVHIGQRGVHVRLRRSLRRDAELLGGQPLR